MPERLDDGLYSEDESDCEVEGISGYMPEADDDLMAAIANGAAQKALMTPLLQRSPLVYLQVSIYPGMKITISRLPELCQTTMFFDLPSLNVDLTQVY